MQRLEMVRHIFHKEQPRPSIIEPATGERQRIIEEECRKRLEHYFSNEEFVQFTADMIELLGGATEQKGKNEFIKQSNALVDKENNVAIVFQQKRVVKYFPYDSTINTVTAEDPTKAERIEYSVPDKKSSYGRPNAVLRSEVRLNQPPAFASYISGRREEFFPSGTATYQRLYHLDTEGQQFCQKVFCIYEQSKRQLPS